MGGGVVCASLTCKRKVLIRELCAAKRLYMAPKDKGQSGITGSKSGLTTIE